MTINWKRVLTAIAIGAVMLYIIFSFAPHGLAAFEEDSVRSLVPVQERKFANQIISASEYRFMIDYVKEHGIDGTVDGSAYKYKVYDISPEGQSTRVVRIVEFIYCYPPWEGVNITVTTHVNFEDGSKIISSLHMDDADIDRMPDSVIFITTEWNANGRVDKEKAASWSTLHPAWTKYLLFVYEKFLEESQGVDP